ncbi:MAG: hypothetical protein AB1505_27555 [Candidatus Latescibacterota bacterium]
MEVVGVLDEMRSGEWFAGMVGFRAGARTRLSWDVLLITALDARRTVAATRHRLVVPAQRAWQLA